MQLGVSLVALKEAEQKAYVLFPEKWVLAELNWQLPEFSKLSFICKQSKKHAGSRDTVTSGAHDFPDSARSCHALYYPPLCGGRAWNKGMVSGELWQLFQSGAVVYQPSLPTHPHLCLQPHTLQHKQPLERLGNQQFSPRPLNLLLAFFVCQWQGKKMHVWKLAVLRIALPGWSYTDC